MNLKSLLLSSDEKTVRILRRVLGDLEIDVEHCYSADDAICRITRQRFEAIIADATNREDAGNLLRAAKAAPVNKRALTIVLVESPVGLKGGFELGAHFVLHKPLAVERAKGSFRAVRALMKRERRLQLRVEVQIPVECIGSGQYSAKTLDLCEGGMAVQFSGRVKKENSLHFSLELPGVNQRLEIDGELAWEGYQNRAGVRFTNTTDEQRNLLRQWLNSQLPEPEQDDPPVNCRLTDLSLGGCYLTTSSPFPRRTRVILKIKTGDLEVRAGGVVLVAHSEFGMGVEFLQTTTEQRNQVLRMITTLRANGDKSPQLLVEPDGLETPASDDNVDMFQSSKTEVSGTEDTLVDLFRNQFQVPVETFLEQMREQRQSMDSR
ncbi:MAG TPA: PilZ domain-containing protein [Terriglobales bacterium]|nr:PilZ domain-containing protein [Terriglobales bacterium]